MCRGGSSVACSCWAVYLKADSVCWVASACGGGWKSSANPETSAPNPPEMKPPNDSGTLADLAWRDRE